MITLNQNIFVGTITNLIAYSIYHDNYRLGDDVDRVLEIFRSDDVPMGDGKVVHTTNLPSVVDLNPDTSSLLTVTKPTITEQYIPVSEYKKVPLSINEYLLRGAFVDEGALGLLASYLINTMQIAKRLHMYNRVLSVIQTVATRASSDEEDWVLPSESDPVAANAAETFNSNKLYRWLMRTIKSVGKGLVANITTTPTSSMMFYDRPDNLVALIDDETFANLNVDTLATLLNSSEITRNVKVELVTVPHNTLSGIKCLLLSKDKIQYGFFYQVATQFFDASNLNTNNWLHFSDYCDQVYQAFSYAYNVNYQ